MRKPALGRLLARRWTVLVAVVVVAVAGFAVYRLHGIFGSNNNVSAGGALPNDNTASTPKHVVIEVFGEPGAQATITYLDVNATPRRVDTTLPWSYSDSTTTPAVLTNVQAQADGNSVSCRITIDGVVKVERSSDGADAYVFCLDKSG